MIALSIVGQRGAISLWREIAGVETTPDFLFTFSDSCK